MVSISTYFSKGYTAALSTSTRPASQSVAGPAAPAHTASTKAPETPFSEVVLAARRALDAGYHKVRLVADERTTWDQWNAVLGQDGMDRRSLYAIASNQGGLFSQAEIARARYAMTLQESEAMLKADPLSNDLAGRFKAGIDFLDSVSAEEKRSFEWASSRAAAQTSYEWRMRDEGRAPGNVDSGNPFVNLIRGAYEEWQQSGNANKSVEDMPSYRRAFELWTSQNQTEQSPLIDWRL